jgi:hypothetical protein
MEMLEFPLAIIAWCVAIILMPITLMTVVSILMAAFEK